MLDIETLDTAPSAVILSIGIVAFNKEQVSVEFLHRAVDIQPQIDQGRTISADTLKWWLNQSDAARHSLLRMNPKSPETVAKDIWDFVSDYCAIKDAKFWGNGSDFDNVKVEHFMRQNGVEPPWEFYNNRCYRTMKNMFPNVTKPKFEGVKHNAEADARHQATHMVEIYKQLMIDRKNNLK